MNTNIQNQIEKKENYSFEDLIKIISILTGENGCPWDKIQTHETLKRYLIEECYEVLDAIDKKDCKNLCEELGDVLLQVVLHSAIAKKQSEFNISDVIDGISKKMIYRHPHIFSDASAKTAEDVLMTWEDLKKKEKGYKDKTDSLKSIPKNLPALMRAEKVLKKSDDKNYTTKKSLDELNNLINKLNEIDTKSLYDDDDISCIIGDILFNTVNISKKFKINPEFALTNSTETFINKSMEILNINK